MKMITFQIISIAFALFVFAVTFIFVIAAYQAGKIDGRNEILTKFEERLERIEK